MSRVKTFEPENGPVHSHTLKKELALDPKLNKLMSRARGAVCEVRGRSSSFEV